MKLLHLDCSSGISGDMWLGALLDAGASIEAVQSAVEALGVGNVRITVGRVQRAGIQATSARVRAPQDTPAARTWDQVRNILRFAAIDDDLSARAVAVFESLARAEGNAHGVDPDHVEFHEVGALDTLADVIGTCAAVTSLNVDRITCGPVAVGSGEVDTPHGPVPVPAPAVTELLRGFTVHTGHAGHELTTPTGAALLATLAEPVAELPGMTLDRVGLGAGAADLAHPNVLRVFLGRAAAVAPVPDLGSA